jgi:hypothetical protein
MAPALLDRVAETTSSDAARDVGDVVRRIIELLPWSAGLPVEDFHEMLVEMRESAIQYRRTGDYSAFKQLADEWEATAEAYGNAGLMQQLARTDRSYMRWED